jgi:class 3 adenylate cyclase/pimeloyl-ACP methyl ester carboxylesterase
VAERPITKYCKAPDGFSLAYQVFGDGPLNVFWTPNDVFPIDLLLDESGFLHIAKRLGRFSRALFCDARGMGASGGNPLDRFSEDVVDADLTARLDAEGFDKAVLIGYSAGGPSVIRYAVMHPSRVSAIVLIDTFAHYLREPGYDVGFSPNALDRNQAWLSENWGSGVTLGLAPSKASDADFRERLTRFERLGARPEQAAQLNTLVVQQDVRHFVSAVSVPTLVVHRAGDAYIMVQAGRWLASHIPGAKYVEAPGADHYLGAGDIDGIVDEIEEFLTGGHQGPEGEVVTATILFTDIVSSTEQSANMGHRVWSRLTDDHNAMVRATLARHRGREIKTVGDGFLATFDSANRGVRAAKAIIATANSIGLAVRAGVHTGEVEVRADDVVGLPVAIAKRVCDLAGSGQVYVTEVVRLHVAGSGMTLTDQGTHVLKGVPDEWRLYSVAV